MRSSFKPEEVDRIENKAYEVGIGVGEMQERNRIISVLESIDDWAGVDCAYVVREIKGEN